MAIFRGQDMPRESEVRRTRVGGGGDSTCLLISQQTCYANSANPPASSHRAFLSSSTPRPAASLYENAFLFLLLQPPNPTERNSATLLPRSMIYSQRFSSFKYTIMDKSNSNRSRLHRYLWSVLLSFIINRVPCEVPIAFRNIRSSNNSTDDSSIARTLSSFFMDSSSLCT